MSASARSARLAIVGEAFRSLADRYLGADANFDATYQVRLGDLGRTWEIRCTSHTARVRQGVTSRRPDVTLSTDAETWLALREGELSGIDAFEQRRLSVSGNLDYAIAFEGLFRLPGGRPPLLQIHDVPARRQKISTLTMGHGPDVLLLHGLGGTRASLFETAAAMSQRYRVHAPDLPGFGSSSKPAHGGYNARWFAEHILAMMDSAGIERAHVVGNSMGGRIGIEMALIAPERVNALGLLCPAVAWIRRGFHPLVRLLRPEFGLLPHGFARRTVAGQFSALIRDQDAIDPAVQEVMVDEFRRIYQSAGARYAFLSSARNIYLEAPYGRHGFYPRLAELSRPSLFVWGSHDTLIPAAFRRHVAKWLPDAEQITLENCGHVPQVERPEETNALLMDFFARAEAADRPAVAPTLRAVDGAAARRAAA
ncbi:MAG TPA: alpha/beta fold hydrolase [Solirubrobacteraceae bacterium]|nr:alpha/beta fold hydrolase [Solirubrobacteraceae bacterium]